MLALVFLRYLIFNTMGQGPNPDLQDWYHMYIVNICGYHGLLLSGLSQAPVFTEQRGHLPL